MLFVTMAAAIGSYTVNLRVSGERAEVDRLRKRLVADARDIRNLQAELRTRARLPEMQRWNDSVLQMSAPAATQYLQSPVQLASFGAAPAAPAAPSRMSAMPSPPRRRAAPITAPVQRAAYRPAATAGRSARRSAHPQGQLCRGAALGSAGAGCRPDRSCRRNRRRPAGPRQRRGAVIDRHGHRRAEPWSCSRRSHSDRATTPRAPDAAARTPGAADRPAAGGAEPCPSAAGHPAAAVPGRAAGAGAAPGRSVGVRGAAGLHPAHCQRRAAARRHR